MSVTVRIKRAETPDKEGVLLAAPNADEDNNIAFPTEDDVRGVESEDTGDSERIPKPFDPALIRVETKPMTIDLLLARIRDGALDLAPDFQRKGGIWTPGAESRLIESILIRIPIPAFYMDATDEDRWVVVDGLQRLTALKRFAIEKKLRLVDLEFLLTLNGKTFDDLPRNLQRRIVETQVVVYFIEKGTPPDVKFNIFKRINTGGLPLSTQEIRHALNQGPVTKYLADLAASKEFLAATDNGIRDDRMADRECVLRFLAFTIMPSTGYKFKDFDSFLSEMMAEINKMSEVERSELNSRFLRAMTTAKNIFGENAFRKPSPWRKLPINKPLFESWSVNLGKLSQDDLQLLEDRKEQVKGKFSQLVRDVSFQGSISVSTGNVSKIKLRFNRIEQLIQEVLTS